MSLGALALIPTFGKDVVAIFEQSDEGNDTQLFADANIMHGAISEKATFFRHPLENGRNLVDHRIIDPVTIELHLILSDRISVLRGLTGGDFATRAADIYNQIRDIYLAGTLLSIQTRVGTFRNQVIQAMPHEESSDMFDGIALAFNTSEIQFEDTGIVTFVPVDSSDFTTLFRGKQNPLSVVTDVAIQVTAQAAGIFGG